MNQKGFSPILIVILITIFGLAVAFKTGYITINQPTSLKQMPVKTVMPQPAVSQTPVLNTPPPVFQDNGPYPTDPTTVTQNFYNWYISCWNYYTWEDKNGNYPNFPKAGADQLCGYKQSRYVSSELIQTLTKQNQDFMNNCESQYPQASAMGGCEQGDSFLCGAQVSATSAKADKALINSGVASVVVHPFYGTEGDPVKVSLKLIDNEWQLTNVSCPNK